MIRKLFWRQFWNHSSWTRTHLVQGRNALCGEAVNWEEYREDSTGDSKLVCRRCRKLAERRGENVG